LTTYLTRTEVPNLLRPTGPPAPFSLKHVLTEVVTALKNRDFLVLFMALLIASAVGGTVEALAIYMNTYFWGFTPEDLRWFVIAFICSGTALFVIAPHQRPLDHKQAFV